MQRVGRRRFMSLAIGGGALAGLTWTGRNWLESNSSLEVSTPLEVSTAGALRPVRRSARALGTTVSLLALHAEESAAAEALAAALAELDLVEEVMSLYRPASQLCRLNQNGRLDKPHPYLVQVLRQSLELSRLSQGAFDVSVQPLWTVCAAAAAAQQLPDPVTLASAQALVDWRRVELDSGRIRLAPGMQLTLNGIAQGFAVDRVLSTLKEHGIGHALVNTGELGAVGRNEQGQRWTAGIQHPRQADAYISLAPLDGRCLATSGDYATSFADDRREHHIFDPRTGYSPTELASVSVLAPSGLLADGLSTALFVLGAEQGSRLLAELPGCDALFVHKDGRAQQTRGFPASA